MKEAISTMVRSNKNLLEMVNTLLEVYRFEAGRKNLVFSPVNLPDLLQEVVQELTPLANEKGLSVKLHLDETEDNHLPKKVVGDRMELHRVFTNLIGNAIKFTDAGSINIRLKAGASNIKPSTAVIEVQDTGAGITPEFQAMLFERFRPGSHRRSSSGLGLHLSRRIMEAHHGKIDVRSDLGQGSTFTVFLPINL
jgi:signal transduction histidine kinase